MTHIHLKLKSFDPYYINQVQTYIYSILEFFSISEIQEIAMPTRVKKFTVIRSPHIDKRSREQFQLKKFKKLIVVNFPNTYKAMIFVDILKNANFIGIELEMNLKFFEEFDFQNS